MRTTQKFEVVGIGEFSVYPAKVKELEFQRVTANKIPVAKKVKEQGKQSVFAWVDSNGNEYTENQVFYDLGDGRIVQKIGRTEKVKKFDIVPIGQTTKLLDKVSTNFLDANDTTRENFKRVVGEGNALKCSFKKSSVGTNWVSSYIYLEDGVFEKRDGLGNLDEAREEFKTILQEQKQHKNKKAVKDTIEISADDIIIEV